MHCVELIWRSELVIILLERDARFDTEMSSSLSFSLSFVFLSFCQATYSGENYKNFHGKKLRFLPVQMHSQVSGKNSRKMWNATRKCIVLVSILFFHVKRRSISFRCTQTRESQLQLIKISTEFVENRFARDDWKISRGESRWRITTGRRGNWKGCTLCSDFRLLDKTEEESCRRIPEIIPKEFPPFGRGKRWREQTESGCLS